MPNFPPHTSILVIDDMMTMRKLIVKQLKSFGFSKISEATDGREAWRKIMVSLESGTPFQLIISDWNMPGITGIELLKRLRQYEKMRDVPFVIITAESEKSEILDAIQSGVSAFVLKPFTATMLREKLEFAYRASKARKAA